MTEQWTKWEKQVINGVFPLHRAVSFSDHSAVFLTEHKAHNLPNALLKLVPAIPTLKETQLAHWSAATTLTHPHLIRLLDAGRCQLGGLQFLFVVMEYAEVTLAKILSQQALAPDALRKGLRPILASLAFLHRKHLVQGGLKPSNILLVNQQLKLASDTVRPSGESTASIAGSSVYDPPESRDGSFSAAGDIWSLGVIMVEALTQRRPSWPDKSSATATLPETLPPQFVPIVRQCLSRNPANRPTVAELEAQIRWAPRAAVASARYPVLLPPRFPVLLPPEPAEPTPRPFAYEEPDPVPTAQQSPKRRSFVPAGAALAVVLIAVWAGLHLFDSQAYSRTTAAPAATAQMPATAVTTPSEVVTTPVTTTSPEPGFVESKAEVIGPPSVLHEEAPDVPLGALATVRGHIRFAVRVTVDPSGNVVHAALINHGPSRYFTRLALETARKWKFAAAGEQDSRQWLLRFEITRDGATAHATNPRTTRSDRAYTQTAATKM
jgi:outer membrane biosynthesis protein TonB